MPVFEDVPFELRHYLAPRSMAVGVADRRTGADTLLVLTGTVVFPESMNRYTTSDRVERRRVRFGLPQSPKVVTARGQVRSLQVSAGIASFHQKAGNGDRCFAIDQSDHRVGRRPERVAGDDRHRVSGGRLHDQQSEL